jgi:hypothetical protein
LMRTPDAQSAQDFEAGWRPTSPPRAPNRKGVNTFVWDMRYPAPSAFRGMILWAAGANSGPMAPPGTYQVRLAVNGKTVGTQRFRLIRDPRVKGVTAADYDAQFRFLRRAAARFGEANDAVKTMRYVKSEVEDRRGKIDAEHKRAFEQHATPLAAELSSVEDSIYQTKSRSGQDPLNYPIRLNNKLGALLGVAGSSDGKPTAQTYEVYQMLDAQLTEELARMKVAITQHLVPLNATLKAAGLAEIVPKPADVPSPKQPAVVP